MYLNLFGGVSSPALILDNNAQASKDALRKYHVINRACVSTIVLIELTVTLALFTIAKSDGNKDNVFVQSLGNLSHIR